MAAFPAQVATATVTAVLVSPGEASRPTSAQHNIRHMKGQ